MSPDPTPGSTPDERLLVEAERLYGLPVEEFTAARDVRAKELRGDDRALADAVRRLRRPTLAAWVVNLLVRLEHAQVAQVLEVGEALRVAQQGLAGEDLRALTRQRRQLTAAVTGRARAVAGSRGVRVTAAVAEQVEATLTAAILDPGCAAALRSGLLVTPLAATGVDPVAVQDAVAVPAALGHEASPAVPEPPAEPRRPDLQVVVDDTREREEAEAVLRDAEEAAAASRERLAAAREETAAASAHVLELEAGLEELRGRLAALEAQAEEAGDALAEAEEARDAAAAEVEEAEEAVAAARAEVARLSR